MLNFKNLRKTVIMVSGFAFGQNQFIVGEKLHNQYGIPQIIVPEVTKNFYSEFGFLNSKESIRINALIPEYVKLYGTKYAHDYATFAIVGTLTEIYQSWLDELQSAYDYQVFVVNCIDESFDSIYEHAKSLYNSNVVDDHLIFASRYVKDEVCTIGVALNEDFEEYLRIEHNCKLWTQLRGNMIADDIAILEFMNRDTE